VHHTCAGVGEGIGYAAIVGDVSYVVVEASNAQVSSMPLVDCCTVAYGPAIANEATGQFEAAFLGRINDDALRHSSLTEQEAEDHPSHEKMVNFHHDEKNLKK
jgi:hypothetical protein